MANTKFFVLTTLDGDEMYYSSLADIIPHIEGDVDSEPTEEYLYYSLEVKYLTPQEVADLPEWNG